MTEVNLLLLDASNALGEAVDSDLETVSANRGLMLTLERQNRELLDHIDEADRLRAKVESLLPLGITE